MRCPSAILVLALAAGSFIFAPRAGLAAEEAPEPTFTPGQVTKVEDAKVGYQGHFLVYVPSDYTPERRWPVIFFYHGMGGAPTVDFLRHYTEGKGFLIVGLPYIQKEVSSPEGTNNTPAANEKRMAVESAALEKYFVPYVAKQFSVDERLFIIAGASRGGWVVGTIIENCPALWGGAIMLAGGRERAVYNGPPIRKPALFKDKPVFIGVGENDPNLVWSRKAQETYAQAGAKVTMEVFAGLGHTVPGDCQTLKDWLAANGPIRFARADLDEARRLEKAGAPGKAYNLYANVGALSETDETSASAREALADLVRAAEGEMAEASRAIAEKNFVTAAGVLVAAKVKYKGCELARQAAERLENLKADPKAREAIEKAQAAQAAPPASVPEPVAATAPAENPADAECAKWMTLADNYLAAGRADLARTYLQKIIDKHPDTKWADEAHLRLARLTP